MKYLLLFFLAGLCCAQDPIEARFEFVEGGPFIIKPHEVKIVNLTGRNGTAQFEMGLIQVKSDDKLGIRAHWQVYGRNLGEIGQLGQPDNAVHPKNIVVVYQVSPNSGSSAIYDRNNQNVAHITSGGLTYGLRDAWMNEPTAHVLLPDGMLAFFVLHDRAPPGGFPIYYGLYQTSLNGAVDEDPLSATNHRWQGGFMKLWDLVTVSKGKEKYIENDPMPTSVPDDWYMKTRSAKPDWRVAYPERYQAILDSLDRVDLVNGEIATTPTTRTFTWWLFQSENRFRYWQDHNKVFDIGNQANNIGWKNWGDLRWIEGHYNNGYNWVSILFRRWLDTRSEESWWLFTRLAKWDATSGIVWSSSVTNGVRSPGWRGGWRWYEKGFSRSKAEVGCDYWPSNYKQYSEAILTANLALNQWWTQEAVTWHGQALFRMGYETWPGIYGERIPGWGMMNAMAYYRFTGDVRWVNLGNAIAGNVLNIMKSSAKMNAELNSKWKDPALGVPYIYDPNNFNEYEYSAWMNAKLCIGFIELASYGNQTQYNAKIRQMARYLMEECIHDNGDILVAKAGMTRDRVPAQYWDGWAGALFNTPNPATTDWLIWPVAYSAVILQDDMAKTMLPKFIRQLGYFMDWSPRITLDFYEVGTATVDADGRIIINNINLTGVDPVKHRVRLQVGNNPQDIRIFTKVLGNMMYVDTAGLAPGTVYTVTITGPKTNIVKSTADRAVRSIIIDSSNKPNMKRVFNWNDGSHFNNWQKILAIPLTQGDLPFVAAKIN